MSTLFGRYANEWQTKDRITKELKAKRTMEWEHCLGLGECEWGKEGEWRDQNFEWRYTTALATAIKVIYTYALSIYTCV